MVTVSPLAHPHQELSLLDLSFLFDVHMSEYMPLYVCFHSALLYIVRM